MKTLCVFDMDHTLCDDYLEESFLLHVPHEIYHETISKYHKHQIKWPHALHTMITAHPPKIETTQEYLKGCKMVQNMKSVLDMLSSQGHTIILISGSNRFCVNSFMENHGITKHFKDTFCLGMDYNDIEKSFTYHPNILDCKQPICTHGYCKGQIVKEYLNSMPHDQIYYFGDGTNDLCGINRITNGTAFVRKGYGLQRNITNQSEKYGKYVKCKVVYWEDGNDITKYFQETEIVKST